MFVVRGFFALKSTATEGSCTHLSRYSRVLPRGEDGGGKGEGRSDSKMAEGNRGWRYAVGPGTPCVCRTTMARVRAGPFLEATPSRCSAAVRASCRRNLFSFLSSASGFNAGEPRRCRPSTASTSLHPPARRFLLLRRGETHWPSRRSQSHRRDNPRSPRAPPLASSLSFRDDAIRETYDIIRRERDDLDPRDVAGAAGRYRRDPSARFLLSSSRAGGCARTAYRIPRITFHLRIVRGIDRREPALKSVLNPYFFLLIFL